MPESVCGIKVVVVVHKIFSSCVVRRVDINELCPASVSTDQATQGVVVVALDNEVFPRAFTAGNGRVKFQPHEILIDGLVTGDIPPFPYQTKV